VVETYYREGLDEWRATLDVSLDNGAVALRLSTDCEGELAVQPEGVDHLCLVSFGRVDELRSYGAGQVELRLRGGRSLRGTWLEFPPDFYGRRADRPASFELGVVKPRAVTRFRVSRLARLQFKPRAPGHGQIGLNGGPCSFYLRDGRTLRTLDGCIYDFCGHDHDTYLHERMDRRAFSWGNPMRRRDGGAGSSPADWKVALVDDGARRWSPAPKARVPEGLPVDDMVPCGDLKSIELGGGFSRVWPGCRSAVVRYSDGRIRQTNLYLTSESYDGICFPTIDRRADLDAAVAETSSGKEVIPLDQVARIVFDRVAPEPSAPGGASRSGGQP